MSQFINTMKVAMDCFIPMESFVGLKDKCFNKVWTLISLKKKFLISEGVTSDEIIKITIKIKRGKK